MSTRHRASLFDKYESSVFAAGNTFSLKEYELMADFYSINYRRYLPEEKDSRILDAGCGAGHFLYFLKRQGYTGMTGIDLSSELVERCRKEVWEKVIVGDAIQHLNENKGTFNFIAANDIVEHVPKNETIRFLQSLRDGLRPGGKVVIKVPNMSNPFCLSLRYGDFTHEAGYTENSLHQVLHLAGFRAISIVGGIHPDRSWKAPLHRTAERILHRTIRRIMMEMGYSVPSILSKLLIAVAQA